VKIRCAACYTRQILTVPILKPRRGRPRKFARPSRPVTLTLPNEVIEALQSIDEDVSRAIVRLVGRVRARRHPPAELVSFGRHAVIVVNPTRTLKRRTGVELVPLPDGRALIAFDQATTIAGLELTIADALDDPDLARADRPIFASIGEILKSARRSKNMVLLQRSIILLEARRAPARTAGRARAQS
jgi:hypothetical protein